MRGEVTGKKMSLITPKEVCELLGVSMSTLAKWRLSGEGPAFVKVGARVAYDPELINTWLLSRVRTSTSDVGADKA